MVGRRAWLGFGALLLCGCAVATFHQKDWGFDDAYISYRYAENLVAGHGLVFNPGERVEGYSNFLYVLLVAPGIALFGRDAAYPWSVALNALLLLGALAGVRAAAAVRVPNARAWWAGLLFAASPAIWIAAASGLETPLVLACFAAAWALVARLDTGQRSPLALAAVLAAIVLARADGFVMAGLVLAYLVIVRPSALGARGLALCAAAAVGTALLQVAARWLYYGYPLPNTYYAKVGGHLFERLQFALQLLPQLDPILPYVAIAAVAAVAALAALPRRAREGGIRGALGSIPFEVFFTAGWLAYWFYVGGDVFGERFLLVLIPLGAVLLARAHWLDRGGAVRWVAAALVLALAVAPWIGTPLRRQRTVYDPWLTLGRFLAEHHPGALVAVDAAGKIPYASRLRAIDTYGLNDAEIAHRPSRFVMPGHSNSDPYYVLARKPDLITGWLNPNDLAIDPGFRAYLYRGEGYALRYLVFAARGVPPLDDASAVISASTLSPEEIAARWRSGYRYGVIARTAPGS